MSSYQVSSPWFHWHIFFAALVTFPTHCVFNRPDICCRVQILKFLIFYFSLSCCSYCEIRDSLVSVATRIRVGRSEVRILAGARDFTFPPTVKTGSGAHPASYSKGTGALSRGQSYWDVKLASHFFSSAEIKNEWLSASYPLVCFHGVDGHNFTFAFYAISTSSHVLHSVTVLWVSSVYI